MSPQHLPEGCRAEDVALQAGPEQPEAGQEEGVVEGHLAREVLVERRCLHRDPAGDLAEAEVGYAALANDRPGRVEDRDDHQVAVAATALARREKSRAVSIAGSGHQTFLTL